MNNSKDMSDRFETLVHHYIRSQEPDPAFIDQLRADLLTARPETQRKRAGLSFNWTFTNWRYAVAAAFLLVIGVVAVIGPARVWAQIENWIAYLPGLGRVELSGTRILVDPVSYSKDGVTFEVKQFVASPDETFINISITGFPDSVVQDLESEELDIGRFSDSVKVHWREASGGEGKLFVLSELNGTNFRPCPTEYCRYMQLEGIFMKIVGGSLPPEITQVQVDWLPYGIVPGAAPTDTWTLTIPLGPISDAYAQDFIQPGYSPQSAEDSQHGVKITVEDVFSGSSGTIIDVFIVAPDLAHFPFLMPQHVFLSADNGYRSGVTNFSNDMDMIGGPLYKVTPEVPRATTIEVWPARWQFEPVDSQASRMTLEIGSVFLSYDTQHMFEVEIGQDPEVGTSFPLDVNFDFEGFPLHIYQARIIMAPAAIDGIVKEVKAIEFLAESTLATDGRRLNMISFCSYDKQVNAEATGVGYECRSDSLPLEQDIIKDGKIRVSIDMVELEQQGPWVISWDVPQEVP